MRLRILLALACAAVVALGSASSANADVGQARTGTPDQYDRNASVVTDAAGTTYLYFARSELPCNRLATPVANPLCPDQVGYDIYVKKSTDGGQDFGPAVRVAQNPSGPGPLFRGRTIAATATPDGVHVFWADGGSNNLVYHAFKPNGQDSFDANPQPVADIPPDAFNVEAVSIANRVYVYTQEYPNINARSYTAAGNALTPSGGPTVVEAGGKSIPKAIVDVHGGCKMTMADDSTYPQVNVYTDASADCLSWPAPARLVVDQPGSNWDPNLIQKPNGEYYLHFAPDHTAAGLQQQVALTQSNDFVKWNAPHDLTPGKQGATPYWDYWPEGFVRNNQIVLFYTSERGVNQAGVSTPAGVGHIWTNPGFGGLDHLAATER
jgi:hypothetical protein